MSVNMHKNSLSFKKFVVHWKKKPFDVYIGHPSKWGNPYTNRKISREEKIQLHREYILSNSELINEIKQELKGKILGCWCSPMPCHGDILAEIANS